MIYMACLALPHDITDRIIWIGLSGAVERQQTRCSPSHRLLLMASLMRWKVWLWPANTRECGWTPSCLHDLFDVTVGSKLTRMSSFVFRSFDKKAAPVSMTKLLSHGYVEEKKTANDDDTSSTLLCSYQPHEGELQWCIYFTHTWLEGEQVLHRWAEQGFNKREVGLRLLVTDCI